MEEGDCDIMRQMIGEAMKECGNFDTLNLVYKILLADDIR